MTRDFADDLAEVFWHMTWDWCINLLCFWNYTWHGSDAPTKRAGIFPFFWQMTWGYLIKFDKNLGTSRKTQTSKMGSGRSWDGKTNLPQEMGRPRWEVTTGRWDVQDGKWQVKRWRRWHGTYAFFCFFHFAEDMGVCVFWVCPTTPMSSASTIIW